MRRLRTAARVCPTPTFLTLGRPFEGYSPAWGEFGEPWCAETGSAPRAVSRSRLADAIAALQNEAQSLNAGLPAFGDPLTADEVERVKAYIGAVQEAVDRLCQAIAPAAGPTRI